jgi:hypothetical protein
MPENIARLAPLVLSRSAQEFAAMATPSQPRQYGAPLSLGALRTSLAFFARPLKLASVRWQSAQRAVKQFASFICPAEPPYRSGMLSTAYRV